MGLIVSSWSEVTLRYPSLDRLGAVSSGNANAAANQEALIRDAEAYVQGRLASGYTPPFSVNNYTAKDLVIDAVFLKNVLAAQPVKGSTVSKEFEAKISALLLGQSQMIDINGTICHPFGGDPTWSSTMNYHPVFGLSESEVLAVDSQQLIDENNRRGWPIDEAI